MSHAQDDLYPGTQPTLNGEGAAGSDPVAGRKPLKVCMVAYTFYEGDNRVMRYAETLARRGDQVDVIALRCAGLEKEEMVNGVRLLRIQSRTYNEKGQLSYLSRLLTFLFRSTWITWNRHRKDKYDVIHVHSVPDFLVLSALGPKVGGAKVILDIHDILPELYAAKFKSGAKSFAFKILLFVEWTSAKLADHVIVANDLWRARLVQRSVPEAKCTTIMNYPDPHIFQRCGRTRDHSRFVILYPGSLNRLQGLDIAIRALSIISDRAPNAEMHIYGDGPERSALVKLAEELGLKDRVFFWDGVPIREIARVMENADLAVVPKRRNSFGNEAFSTKTLEFMALGVPLIVSDTDIDKYYFRDSQVMFFKSEDENDLAAAMLTLIENPELRQRLVERGLAFAAQNDWGRKQDLYLNMIDGLTGASRTSPGDAGGSE